MFEVEMSLNEGITINLSIQCTNRYRGMNTQGRVGDGHSNTFCIYICSDLPLEPLPLKGAIICKNIYP